MTGYSPRMIRLGVNIDHVATLRQARYRERQGMSPEPDLLAAATAAEQGGAHGITIHLREDRRHIQDADVNLLRRRITTRLNLELADVPEIIEIAEGIRPDEACLVPERRLEITTEGGLDVRGGQASLGATVARLQRAGIGVSMFIDPDPDQVRAAADVGANHIELHTGRYANVDHPDVDRELECLATAATLAHDLGLGVNAGHGLNYANTQRILHLPHLDTLNIGHAIVSRAVFVGLEHAVHEMLALIQDGPC